MTVPRRLPDAAPAGPVLYKQILCPVDFSESSLRALTYATSMAREADSQLTVLHVVAHEFEYTPDIDYGAGMTIGDFLKEREDTLHDTARGAGGIVSGAHPAARLTPMAA